jgi:hypothetical protein
MQFSSRSKRDLQAPVASKLERLCDSDAKIEYRIRANKTLNYQSRLMRTTKEELGVNCQVQVLLHVTIGVSMVTWGVLEPEPGSQHCKQRTTSISDK